MVGLTIVGGIWWWRLFPLPEVPNHIDFWVPNRPVSIDDVVVEKKEEVYHLYLNGFHEKETHRKRPLFWRPVVGKSDFSVTLEGQRGEPSGSFAFWFGSLSRFLEGGESKTVWFTGDGTPVSRDVIEERAVRRGVSLVNWQRRIESSKSASLHLRMVGNFEGVTGGFIAQAQAFEPPNPEPVSSKSWMHPSHDLRRQSVNLDLSQESLEGVFLAVHLAWGDEMTKLEPQVGAKGEFDEFSAELIFLEPLAKNTAKKKGRFAEAFELSTRDVETTTAAFFVSRPELAFFLYPKMVARSGKEEVRYFLNTLMVPTADIPSVTMPVAIDELDRIELHYRNHRVQALFPLDGLPLPES